MTHASPLHASSASAEPSLHCRSRLLAAPPQAWESAAAATSSGAAPPGGAARHFCCCPAGRSVVAAAAWQRGPSLLPLISGAAFSTMLTLVAWPLHHEYHKKINKEMHHSFTLTALTYLPFAQAQGHTVALDELWMISREIANVDTSSAEGPQNRALLPRIIREI